MHSFSHTRPIRNKAGEIISHKAAPAVRITRGTLDGAYGIDRNKQLVVALKDGDIIEMRPAKTRRALAITAFDLYGYLIRLAAGIAARQKREEKKAVKEAKLARARQERAERKLFQS